MNIWEIFYERFIVLEGYKLTLTGLKNTAFIAVFGLVIGFFIGAIIAIVKLWPSKNWFTKILKGICEGYIAIFRGTPIVVQLLLIHFVLFPLMGININSVLEAIIAFGLNSGAYLAEMIRGGINSVDSGQMEAGRSLGYNYSTTMVKIILPQAIKNILPTLGNEFIALIKETSVVGFIAVMDLTRSFETIAGSTYEYVVPYVVLALCYLVIVLAVTFVVKMIEKHLKKNERR